MQEDNLSASGHHRRSIRLKGYDYSLPGAYFVTICTHKNHSLFGKIINGEMQLNDLGKAVQSTWDDLGNHVDNIELGPFMIMPNHIHGIIQIIEGQGADSEPARTNSALTTIKKQTPLSEIVRQFKTFSTRRINKILKTNSKPVWQRNYYEHIIRDDKSFQMIGEYILANPIQWNNDRYYPGAHHDIV